MSQFILLLHHDFSNLGRLSPEEMQKAIEKYIAWTKKPFMVSSQRLSPEPGKVIREQGRRIADGPYSETKEMLGGFYVIEAADFDEAVKRSLDHPHLEYGGTMEIRKLFEA